MNDVGSGGMVLHFGVTVRCYSVESIVVGRWCDRCRKVHSGSLGFGTQGG